MLTNTFVRDSVGECYIDNNGYFKSINGMVEVNGTWYMIQNGYKVN